MSWKILLIFTLIVLLGCTNIKDCGKDINCFEERSKECLKTKVLVEEDNTLLKVTIRGIEDNECKVSLKVEELGENIKKKYPVESRVAEGKTLNCQFPLNTTDYIERITDFEEEVDKKCSGPLKEISRLYLRDILI